MNLLLHATNPLDPRYDRAREWFEAEMNGGDRVGLPWSTLVSFVRLSSQKSVRQVPLPVTEALEYVEGWLEWETVCREAGWSTTPISPPWRSSTA